MRLSSESPKSGRARRSQSIHSRGRVNLSDFCRNYQQPTNNTSELALRISSRICSLPPVFRLYSASLLSLYSMLPLVFRFPSFSAALVYSDIAAVCCDSRIVHWQEILSPSDWPPWLPRSAAALAMASIRHPGDYTSHCFLFATFPENIDTFLRKLTDGICSQSSQSSQIIQ